MIEVDITEECEEALDNLARLTDRTRDSLIQEIVEEALPKYEREAEIGKH